MSHHRLREDKKCQNCGYLVRKRFCPKCGQENIETRQSFHYLFTHFVEDLVHYDGSFWKTLKNLLFKPGVLTKEYLDGKRKKYVAPVKLYIFVSFFVFFVGGFIGKLTYPLLETRKKEFQAQQLSENIKKTDSLVVHNKDVSTERTDENSTFLGFSIKEKSLKEYDSIQNNLPKELQDNFLERRAKSRALYLEDNYSAKEIRAKFLEAFTSNFQKFLFFYMPVFAFFMWLFHSKKKWYYFDHGIFTLHYFSFILISFFCINSVIEPLSYLSVFQNWFFDLLFGIITFILSIWTFIYFFKALRKVYGYSRINTFFRGIFLLFLNSFFFVLGILTYLFIIFYFM